MSKLTLPNWHVRVNLLTGFAFQVAWIRLEAQRDLMCPWNYDWRWSVRIHMLRHSSRKTGRCSNALPGYTSSDRLVRRIFGITNIDEQLFYLKISPITETMQIPTTEPTRTNQKNAKISHGTHCTEPINYRYSAIYRLMNSRTALWLRS